MKKGICCACSLILMFSGGVFSTGYSNNLSLEPNTSIVGIAQLTTEQLIPGEPKAGSIPSANPGSRILSETQYTIQYPGGGAKLVLEFHPDYSVNFYVRRNLPVAREGNNIVSDFGAVYQKLSLPYRPPLDAATYFIAVENYSPRTVNFTLMASLEGPPTADTVDLSFPSFEKSISLELGSIPMPELNTCALGRTQYTISLADSMFCEWATNWSISLRGDQDLNLYVRYGERVAVEDGKVVADFASKPPTGNGQFSVSGSTSTTPMVRTYFVAVENCNPNATNYSLVFSGHIPDLAPPTITSVFLEGKNLHVMGSFFDSSAIVLFDGEPQKTKFGGVFGDQNTLIAKGARHRIARGQSVMVAVKLYFCTMRPFLYTRLK